MTLLKRIRELGWNLPFLFALPAFALPGFSQEIQWIRSFSEGMKLARDGHRPALVDFWSEWCIPCKQMDREAYTDPGLIDSSRRFVLIRVDVDSDPATAGHFGIKSLPTRLFLDPRESILREVKGLAKASDILATMNSIPESSVTVEDSAACQDVPDAASPQAARPGGKVEMIPGALPNTIIVAGKEYTPPATIVDLSIPELLQKYPQELTGIEFDSNQQELDFLLRKVGERVRGIRGESAQHRLQGADPPGEAEIRWECLRPSRPECPVPAPA